MRRTLVDKLAERVGDLGGDLVASTAANLQIPVGDYTPQPQPEPAAIGVPIIAGEMSVPDFDELLRLASRG